MVVGVQKLYRSGEKCAEVVEGVQKCTLSYLTQ